MAVDKRARDMAGSIIQKTGNTILGTEYTWVIGSLGTSNGVNASSTTRLRSPFIFVKAGNKVYLSDYTAKKYRIFIYTNSSVITFSTLTDYMTSGEYIISSDCYIRVIIANSNDSTITDTSLGDYFRIYENTLPRFKGESTDQAVMNQQYLDNPRYVKNLYASPGVTAETYPLANSAYVYGLYDALATANPGYITKTLLGNDVTELPIYEYDFKPFQATELASMYGSSAAYITDNIALPKILITSGVHGDEQKSIIAVYNFFSQLCSSTNADLKFMRENIQFKVVPVVNPYGVDNNQHENSVVGCMLNLNFGLFTQLEQQHLRDWFLDNLDAKFYVDSHNTNPYLDTRDDLDKYAWSCIATNQTRLKRLGVSILNSLGKVWRATYTEVATAYSTYYTANSAFYPIVYATPFIASCIADHVNEWYGIPSVLLENENYDVFNLYLEGTANPTLIDNVALDVVTNFMIGLVENIK